MGPGSHVDQPDWSGHHSSIALRHKCGPWCWLRPQVPEWPLMGIGVTDINTAPLRLAPGNSPGPDICLDSGCHLSIPFNRLLTTLSPANKTYCLSLSSTSLPCTFSTQWCFITQCQDSLLCYKWCLIEYHLPQPQGTTWSHCLSSLLYLCLETLGSTSYDGTRSWLIVIPKSKNLGKHH